ncbi:MAG: 23S rRNA methyltransferase [Gammaproteobacteria bacterium]|nr:23S rRNA methyltransferase [Gammaproteobacteria bacterium]
MPRRSRSSGHWRKQQHADPYVQRAAREHWRSRAVFKLEQIQTKARVLRPGLRCIDLGAAPGGWSQYAAQIVGPKGYVLAVDLAPVAPIEGVDVIQGDFTAPETLTRMIEALGNEKADLVMSDVAPNITGNRAVDQPRAMNLAEEALALCETLLRPGGSFLVKLFQGEGFESFVETTRTQFQKVRLIKPKASRPESREIYLLARNYGI